MEFLHSTQYDEALAHSAKMNRFEPQENYFLEISVHEEAGPPVVSRGSLHESNMSEWLNKAPDDSALGALKLIISKPQNPSDRVGRYIPFSQPSFEEILRCFRIPRQFLYMAIERSASAAKFITKDPTDGSTWICFMMRWTWAGIVRSVLACSFNPERGITYGIVEGYFEFPNLDSFIDHIISAKMHICHPMLMPAIIFGAETDNHETHTSWEAEEMYDFEAESRTTVFYREDAKKAPDLMKLNRDGMLMVRINDVTRDSGYTLRSVRSAILAYKLMLQTIDIMESHLPESRRQNIVESGKGLRDYIDYQINLSENLALRAQETQHRATLQMSAIYNLLLQRDNLLNLQVAKDSARAADSARQDSSAMKTIAVLTILFLPGTFVASFFSMPLFDWNAPSLSVVTKPRFYLYWVVTIPATVLVIVIWIIWIRISNRNQEAKPPERTPDENDEARPSSPVVRNTSPESGPGAIRMSGAAVGGRGKLWGFKRRGWRRDVEGGAVERQEGSPVDLRTNDTILRGLFNREKKRGMKGNVRERTVLV